MTSHRAPGGTILYVGGTLPARSETFVYREVLALRERGISIITASVHAPERGLGEERLDQLANRAIEIYSRGRVALLVDAAVECVNRPAPAICTLMTAVRDVVVERDITVRSRPKVLWQMLAGLALARRVRGRGIGHIHAHMAHVPTTIAMYAAIQLGITFSFTGHAFDVFRARTLLAAKLRRAAFIACISEWHRALYRAIVDRTDRAMPIVRCGVAMPENPNTGLREASSAIQMVAVGRLVPKKGFDILLRALAALPSDVPKWRCTIVGDGPERDRLHQLRAELALADRVEIAGAQPHASVLNLLDSSDLCVLPCRIDADGDRDGLPVALMEAMARSVCVISGDLPAMRELIEPGRSGELVPPGDLTALTDTLDAVLRDAGRRERLGTGGRDRVELEFTTEVNALRLIDSFARTGVIPAIGESGQRDRTRCAA